MTSLQGSDLAQQLAREPSRLPNARRYFGLLGPDDDEARVRLYITEGLELYWLFNREDVAASKTSTDHMPMTKDAEPLEGTSVWVTRRATAELRLSDAARRTCDQFLEGDLMADILPDGNLDGLTTRVPGIRINVPTWIICGISPVASVIIAASVAPKTRHHNT